MIVCEQDAAALPSYKTYELGNTVLRKTVQKLGGYAVHGAENLSALDSASYILAPSHRSKWDSIIMGLTMLDLPELTRNTLEKPLEPRAVHFMAKDALWRWPVVKQFIEGCGAFPVKRDTGVGLNDNQVDHVKNLQQMGAVICIFPEGHRERRDIESVDPAKLKTTIGFLALNYGLPVVPVGIYGPVRGRKLPRTLAIGQPIMVERFAAQSREAEFRQRKYDLMDEIHSGLNANYQLARGLHHTVDPMVLAAT